MNAQGPAAFEYANSPSKRKSSPRRNRGSSAEGTTRRLLRPTATKPDEQIENPTCGNDAVPSLFAHVFLVQHDNRERNGENADPPQNPQPRFAPLRGLLRGLLGLGRNLRLESWLGGWLIAGLLRRKRCLRRFRLSPLAPLLEFVPSLFCPVELDFLNLVIYRQGGTAIAAESHFPIHVDFKPSAAAWAGKVDDLHENPFRITSTNASRKTGIISAAASSRFAMPTILSTRLMNVPTIVQVRSKGVNTAWTNRYGDKL